MKTRRTDMEISTELRLKTLEMILKGLDVEQMANESCVSVKGIKFRLTNIYKFYGVKNRYQLMAKYVTLPKELIKTDLPLGIR